MFYYAAPLLIFFLISTIEFIQKKDNTFSAISILSFIPLFIVVVLRGKIGTDTSTYIDQFTIRHQGLDLSFGSFEPGFEFLVEIILGITNDPKVSVNVLSAINAIIFFIAIRMWGGNLLFAAACIVPGYFFDFTMNGLRIGLAFSFCIFSCIALEHKKYFLSGILLILSIRMQFTSIALFILLASQNFKFKLKFKKAALIALIFILAYFSLGDFIFDRILEKIDFYELLIKPNETSGWFPLGSSFVLFLLSCLKLNRGGNRYEVIFNLFLFLVQFLFFQITLITYAGIRFQLLALLAHLMYSQRILFPIFSKRLLNILLLSVLFTIFSSWKIRSFLGEQGEGPSPFLPYDFFWNN